MNHLIRKDKDTKSTGILIVGDFQFKVESLPWNDNKVGKSSVPDDIYAYRVDKSVNKDRGVIELIGVPNRSQIQIHAKGTKSYGCIELLPDGIGETAREVEGLVTSLMGPCGYINITTLP